VQNCSVSISVLLVNACLEQALNAFALSGICTQEQRGRHGRRLLTLMNIQTETL
jgi:hypothetical protein